MCFNEYFYRVNTLLMMSPECCNIILYLYINILRPFEIGKF